MKTQIDVSLKKEINELSQEEVSRKNSYAYEHELLWYGIDALIHIYIMVKARRIYLKNISKEDFVKKYGITFSEEVDFIVFKKEVVGFYIPSIVLDLDNIFVPIQVYSNRSKNINLFQRDYGNIIGFSNKLINRNWEIEDLENEKLIEDGIKFAEELWKTCILRFYEYSKKEINGKRQSQKVTELGEKLIVYYSSVINELKNLR